MAASNPEVMSVDRSSRFYLIALILLVVLLGFLSVLAATPTPGSREYVVGQFVGGLIAPALITAVIYALVRLATRKKPQSTSLKITFWVVLVWSFLMCANLIGKNSRAGAAKAGAVTTGALTV